MAGDLSSPCGSVLTTHNQLPNRASDPREHSESSNTFHSLVLDVSHYHVCIILLVTQVSPIQRGRGLDKGMNARRPGLLGANAAGRLTQDQVYRIKKGIGS